jgi:NAD(P)H dehydrogenase (quinone)
MIFVAGASGHLGHHAVEQLLAKGEKVVAAVRHLDKAKDLAAKGVEVRHADFDRPETLDAALEGAKELLFISADTVAQHRAVVDAAKRAGVTHLAYTSIPRADSAQTKLGAKHRETEQYIAASGVPYTFLRNSWYIENYTAQLAGTLKLGTLYSAAGNGIVSLAPRADYAAAAVAVVTSSGHEGKIYELGGESLTPAELAAKFSAWAGKPIAYVSLPFADFKAALVGAGVPAAFADVLADSDLGLERGELHVTSGDLERLLGRKPLSVDAFLARLPKP